MVEDGQKGGAEVEATPTTVPGATWMREAHREVGEVEETEVEETEVVETEVEETEVVETEVVETEV